MSASPEPADDQGSKGQEKDQITFRFCRECSNMLYPKEDRLNNTLLFACRTCQFSEPAISSCVFRNQMYNTVGETAGVTQDVGSDPTVNHIFLPDFCTLCGQEAICFMCGEAECVGFVGVGKGFEDGEDGGEEAGEDQGGEGDGMDVEMAKRISGFHVLHDEPFADLAW
ncbi:MAG: hypothetical protein MMC33_007205 [Icmadophila ericetorum]|nr:hypothetical protein [Icmadophila ericetorum]